MRVLSRLFRGKLLAFLRQAFAEGKLKFFGSLADLAQPARFHAWLKKFAEDRVGGIRQTTVWRTGGGLQAQILDFGARQKQKRSAGARQK